MAYYLSLSPIVESDDEPPSAKETLSALACALEAAEVGPETFVFTSGHTQIRARAVPDRAGGLREVEVVLPFGAVEEEVAEAVRQVLVAAGDHGLRCFDPQVGRLVDTGDASVVVDRYTQAGSYHLNFSGLSEDGRHGMASAARQKQPSLLSPRLKMMGVALIIFVVFYMLLQALIIGPIREVFSPEPVQTLERPQGPPPGWFERNPPN